MNDNPTIKLPGLPQATIGNADVIRVLEDALARAKSGQLHGVGVVFVLGPDSLGAASAGAFPSTLIAGCHLLAQKTLESMMAPRRLSGLVVPTRRM